MLPFPLPLARTGYTLHIYTFGRGGLRPSTHIARLMRPDGHGQLRSGQLPAIAGSWAGRSIAC